MGNYLIQISYRFTGSDEVLHRGFTSHDPSAYETVSANRAAREELVRLYGHAVELIDWDVDSTWEM